ncbi:hypothetical protein AB6A40_006937 [Gnathostoma spinigerum]|uniref:Coatomer subunit epsilon n=1 Tax=Gnathostoma spinigerum TaxID=75299 RepID=A0ABD6EJS4_9BILA
MLKEQQRILIVTTQCALKFDFPVSRSSILIQTTMSKSADVDLLFEVRNSFYMGAYQDCITTAQNLKLKSDEEKLAKDVFMYRAYIAQNKLSVPLSEIREKTSPPALTAVHRFAYYLSEPSKRSAIVEDLEKSLSEDTSGDSTVLLMAAQIYMNEQNYENALRVLHHSDDLECRSATVQCLLRLHRVDLAMKEVKKMQEVDEDATITQLSLAAVNVSVGKEKLKDAFYIYQEMIDKYGPTPLLQVAQASCLIQQQKYAEAENLLNEAQQRDSNYAEALINLIVVSQFLGKSAEVTNRYINQMKEGHPTHPWTKDFIAKEKFFERIATETTA